MKFASIVLSATIAGGDSQTGSPPVPARNTSTTSLAEAAFPSAKTGSGIELVVKNSLDKLREGDFSKLSANDIANITLANVTEFKISPKDGTLGPGLRHFVLKLWYQNEPAYIVVTTDFFRKYIDDNNDKNLGLGDWHSGLLEQINFQLLSYIAEHHSPAINPYQAFRLQSDLDEKDREVIHASPTNPKLSWAIDKLEDSGLFIKVERGASKLVFEIESPSGQSKLRYRTDLHTNQLFLLETITRTPEGSGQNHAPPIDPERPLGPEVVHHFQLLALRHALNSGQPSDPVRRDVAVRKFMFDTLANCKWPVEDRIKLLR